jgi:ABC-type dipeptide/oligopeptide/nickel transport system permease subunit
MNVTGICLSLIRFIFLLFSTAGGALLLFISVLYLHQIPMMSRCARASTLRITKLAIFIRYK